MRKITFGVANSLDNCIARIDHAVDWLSWDEEVNEIVKEFWKNIDVLLMGRKTFEIFLKHGSGGASPNIKTYVFSDTLKDAPPGVELVSGDAIAFVRTLKSREGKDICLMGGGELAKSFLEAGLLDEIGVNIHPVILGSGIPLFYQMPLQVDLELITGKFLKNGCVYLLYRVKK